MAAGTAPVTTVLKSIATFVRSTGSTLTATVAPGSTRAIACSGTDCLTITS